MSDKKDADIIAFDSTRKAQPDKKKKIAAIKEAFERYLPLKKVATPSKKKSKKKPKK